MTFGRVGYAGEIFDRILHLKIT